MSRYHGVKTPMSSSSSTSNLFTPGLGRANHTKEVEINLNQVRGHEQNLPPRGDRYAVRAELPGCGSRS